MHALARTCIEARVSRCELGVSCPYRDLVESTPISLHSCTRISLPELSYTAFHFPHLHISPALASRLDLYIKPRHPWPLLDKLCASSSYIYTPSRTRSCIERCRASPEAWLGRMRRRPAAVAWCRCTSWRWTIARSTAPSSPASFGALGFVVRTVICSIFNCMPSA